MLPISIEFLNWFPHDDKLVGIRKSATAQIMGLLNQIQALRDHNEELLTENARYKRALTDIANFNDEHWGERVTAEMMFNLSAKAQSALDDLPF